MLYCLVIGLLACSGVAPQAWRMLGEGIVTNIVIILQFTMIHNSVTAGYTYRIIWTS